MSTAEAAVDARELFGGHFYRMLNPEDEHFIISPASVQKLLLVGALGADPNLTQEMLWDLEIKHLDIERLRKESMRRQSFDLESVGEMIRHLEREHSAPIKREQLIEFFENDFQELGTKIQFENFIAAHSKHKFKKDFIDFAKKFFNVTLVHKNSSVETRPIDQLFPGTLREGSKKLEFFSSVKLKLSLKPPFQQIDNENFVACGTFKFRSLNFQNGDDFYADILEIPLESDAKSPVTMLIFIPNYFRRMISQVVGRELRNFDEISSGLQERQVKVTLPKMNWQSKTDLTDFFCDNYIRGVGTFFNEEIVLDRMLTNSDHGKIEVGCYWQYTKLEIIAPEHDTGPKKEEFDIDFDTIGKSFFYIIRSPKVPYIMGQYWQGSD